MSRLFAAALAFAVATVAAIAAPPAPARAANLTQITGFGSNPGNLAMYSYRPDGLPARSPLVVLLHGCTQDANGYFTNSGWRKFADQWRFQLLLPQQSSANQGSKCFTWYDNADINRGQGEALSIRTMVGHAVSNLGADAGRVYVSGLSAGGAMSAVMLATYPDVFKAGSIAAGLPYKCATSMAGTSSCQYTGVDKTPQQWGDLVRAQGAGPYPRVAIWHGASDTVVVPRNATELMEQWTNLRGVSQAPTSTGTNVKVFGDNDVRLWQIPGMAHGLPVDPGAGAQQCGSVAAYFLDTMCSAYHDAVFFGLDSGTPTPTASPTASPTPSPTPTATPGPCVTASNYAHVQAGRAYHSLGYAYANGSNQRMGLYNTFYTTALRQTGPGYWVIGC